MAKLKRVSENQLNKDAYEAEEDEDPRFAVQPDPGQGMTRASEDVMQRRKILKVSRYDNCANCISSFPMGVRAIL
jgi:hypothetical protein